MNPFYTSVDWALQGKYCRVICENVTYEGWVERVNHHDKEVVLHQNQNGTRGSMWIPDFDVISVVKPTKRVVNVELAATIPHPDYDASFTPKDEIIRRCYRNQYAGSFPVVRELTSEVRGTATGEYQILNGHKRIEAAKVAGLSRHPMEVIRCTDEQAAELVRVEHRSYFEQAEQADEEPSSTEDDPDHDSDEKSHSDRSTAVSEEALGTALGLDRFDGVDSDG